MIAPRLVIDVTVCWRWGGSPPLLAFRRRHRCAHAQSRRKRLSRSSPTRVYLPGVARASAPGVRAHSRLPTSQRAAIASSRLPGLRLQRQI